MGIHFKITDGIVCDCPQALYGDVVFPEGITGIKQFPHARENIDLHSLIFPEGLRYIGDLTFARNTGLKKISLPSTLESLGDVVFWACTKLKEVIFPASLKEIGTRAFAECVNLERIVFQGTDVSFTASSFSGCTNLTEVVLPEKFLATSLRRPAMLIPFVKELEPLEQAHIWLFQDDKWLAAIQENRKDIIQLVQHLIELVSSIEKLTPKLQKRLTDFVDWAYPEITCDHVQALCDVVAAKDPKVAKKFSTAEPVLRGLKSERTVVAPEPIEAFAETLLEHRPLHSNATVFTKGIPYAGQDKLCTPRLLNILVSEYLYLFDTYQSVSFGEMSSYVKLEVPEDAVIPEQADRIADSLDREELSQVLENMVYSSSKAYRPWMYAYARFATEDSVKKLLRHPPSGSTAKVQHWRENLEEALLFSETDTAIAHFEKKKKLEQYARMRGMSVQVFRDKASLPHWDMDENSVINSTFGRFGYQVTPDFALRPFELESGKILRSIPTKTDPEAAQEFKELKKGVSDFYKKRSEYIRGIYITAETIAVSHWTETHLGNPILRLIAEKVIWSDSASVTFVVQNGIVCTACGTAYEPKDFVRIAHALDMSTVEIEAWQVFLKENGKKLLIEQVWEPLSTTQNAQIYENMILSKEDRNEFKRILGRKGISVRSESDYSEFDHRANKYVFSDTGTMFVGNALEIRYRVNEETGATTLLDFC